MSHKEVAVTREGLGKRGAHHTGSSHELPASSDSPASVDGWARNTERWGEGDYVVRMRWK